MRSAFKEWAIVVDALGRGEQIVILRKGGIREERGGFQVEHREFLLFPTLYHQQRGSVLPGSQERYDEIAPSLPKPDELRLEYFAEMVDWRNVDSRADAENLRGQHIWREEVIAERFDWGRSQNIFALAVRVFRLPQPIELPMRESYCGCKSWVELETEIETAGATPVLEATAFEEKLAAFAGALGWGTKREPASHTAG